MVLGEDVASRRLALPCLNVEMVGRLANRPLREMTQRFWAAYLSVDNLTVFYGVKDETPLMFALL